jgi:hypothetical protein
MVIRGGAFVAVAAVAVTGVAEANPTVSAEFPLDPRVATVPAEASLALARQPVACNPGGCLAVWKVPNAARTRSVAIRALRLGPSGAAVEPGIVVGSSETRSLDSAAVATDGSGYLVVWQVDGRSIVASRVSAAGAVLDPGGVVIATSDHALQDPMVAWNGRDYLVVWQAESPTTRVRAIRGARVSPTGVVRDPAGLAIGGAAAYRQQFPVVAAAGERFVVAWEDGRVAPSGDLYVARVAADGTVLDPAGVHPFATFRTRTAAALSSDGARVLLGWQDGMGIPGGNGVYAALLGADGVAVGPGTLVDPQYRAFSLAFDGLHHLAAWRTDTGLAYTRLTPEGAPLPADRQQITGSFGSVFVASGGAGFQGITEGVRAFRLAASGAVTSAPAVISTSANAQSELRVASDGVGFVATWLDRGGAMAARVAPAGAVLDAPPLSVAAVASQLRVAFDGAAWLATWSNGGTAGAARIPAAGAVTPLTSAGGFVPPQFLGEGRGYVMATWLTRALGALLTGEVQRLSAPALTPGPRLAVTPQATTQNGVPVVAFDGTNHLVAWHEGTGLPPYCGYVSVLRVTPDGDRLDPMPLRLSPCLVADPSLQPGVAFDGSNYLVVWHAPGSADIDVFAARVSRAGASLDASPLVLSAAPGDQRNPTAVYDGSRFVVAWEDGRAGNLDVYATRVRSTGAVVDPLGLALAASTTDESGPRLAVRTGGQALLAYVRRSPTLHVDRVEGRIASFDDAPPDAGVVDAGVVDTGVVDVGAVDVPAVDVPAVDAPVVDAPVVDVPVVDVPLVDASDRTDVGATPLPGDEGLCSVAAGPGVHTTSVRGVLSVGLLALAARRRRRRALPS